MSPALSNYLAQASVVSVLANDKRTANVQSTAIDLSSYEGQAVLILDGKIIGGTAPTLTVNFQHSDAQGSGHTTDFTFPVISGAGTNGFFSIPIEIGEKKKWGRVDVVITGSPTDYELSVSMVAQKKYR